MRSDLTLQILVLSIQVIAVGLSGSAVGRLQGQLPHPLQHIADLDQCTICSLDHTDGVIGIPNANF